jgi:hypothetical protein
VLPLLYVARLDLSEEARLPFAEWYGRRHAPDVVGAGFLSAATFRALRGNPSVCNIYELRDLDAFGPAYQQARAADEEGARMRTMVSDQRLAVYEQLVARGVIDDGDESPRWRTAVLAPLLVAFRFSATIDQDVLDWYHQEEAGRMAAEPGCLSVRLGRQVDAGLVHVDSARWSVVAEYANQASALRAADGDDLRSRHERALGEVTATSLHVLLRHFTLHNPDGWQA